MPRLPATLPPAAPAILLRIQQPRPAACDAIWRKSFPGSPLKHIFIALSRQVGAVASKTGFPLTLADQAAFITYLADTAHSLGLAFGLKVRGLGVCYKDNRESKWAAAWRVHHRHCAQSRPRLWAQGTKPSLRFTPVSISPLAKQPSSNARNATRLPNAHAPQRHRTQSSKCPSWWPSAISQSTSSARSTMSASAMPPSSARASRCSTCEQRPPAVPRACACACCVDLSAAVR